MNREQMLYLADATFMARRDVQHTQKQLAERLTDLAARLTRSAQALASWNVDQAISDGDWCTPINSLGEVQGGGSDADRLCALFDAQYRNYVNAFRQFQKLTNGLDLEQTVRDAYRRDNVE